jgi:hypothetical protein
MKKTFNNYGQSLLEVILALGLLIVVVAALTVTTSQGLQNSHQSQKQAQAVKLAQEGVDLVRNSAKQNCEIEGFGLFWEYEFINEHFRVNDDCKLRVVAVGDLPTIQSHFKRDIQIVDESDNLKKITVKVLWSDASGEHQSEQVTFVSRF